MISLTLRGSDQSTQGETGRLQDGKKPGRGVYRFADGTVREHTYVNGEKQ